MKLIVMATVEHGFKLTDPGRVLEFTDVGYKSLRRGDKLYRAAEVDALVSKLEAQLDLYRSSIGEH